jgi:hypothetical protein
VTPEEKRRHYAAERVAYTAVILSEAQTIVRLRTERLQDRLTAAADAGVPRAEAEAMTRDLEGIDVAAMLDQAYEGEKQT